VTGVTRPQPFLNPLTPAAVFLVITVDDGGEDAVRDLLGDVAALRRSVGFRVPDGRLDVIVGIGSDLWDRLHPGAPKPSQLHPFVPLTGPVHSAPATPGDLLVHIKAATMDQCFELGRRLLLKLGSVGHVVDETYGFRWFEQRDLLGFVDGTENPEADDAYAAAVLPATDPFAGGSYVTVQKYLHDLTAWEAMSVEEQERSVGRTKLDDIEIPDDQKAPDSHVALNDLDDNPDGSARAIVRANMPFGTLGDAEYGTYFIGYAADLSVTEEMLRHMFLGKPPAAHDRLLDVSRAVTGGVFFCPSIEFLDDEAPN
jgi:putative iron-dependent peroxidase